LNGGDAFKVEQHARALNSTRCVPSFTGLWIPGMRLSLYSRWRCRKGGAGVVLKTMMMKAELERRNHALLCYHVSTLLREEGREEKKKTF
jgi:hypothetical protein